MRDSWGPPYQPSPKNCQKWHLFKEFDCFWVLWKCHLVTLSKTFLRHHPSVYLSLNLGINWIISRIPQRISIFYYGSYKFLAILEQIQYCKITVRRIKVKSVHNQNRVAQFWLKYFSASLDKLYFHTLNKCPISWPWW